MRAASRRLSGTPLIAAENTTVAKPVWIQIMTTISSRVFSLKSVLSNHSCVSCVPGRIGSRPVHTALSRPMSLPRIGGA